MKEKGFTLIELLAVIIILGILMIIAIPSVTKYISDSRKNSYIYTAKEAIAGARNLVNSGSIDLTDKDTTYYISSECIRTDNALKSPYGEFTKAYVVVTTDGNNYDYFWLSVDDTGQGVKTLTKLDKLSDDDIVNNINVSDIIDTVGIDGRSHYMIIDESTNCGKGNTLEVSGMVSGETGLNPIIYPEGKDKTSLVMGDVVKIGTEEFYVVKHQGNDVVLLAKYNLKAGYIIEEDWDILHTYTKEDEGYGLQCSECLGIDGDEPGSIYYGAEIFSETEYWADKVGSVYQGVYCREGSDYIPGTNCLYVYDSNSNLYKYINNYKNYLSKLGAYIKEARLLRYEEAYELGCRSIDSLRKWDCLDGPSWVYSSTYWLGSVDYWVYRTGETDYGWMYVIYLTGEFYTDYTSDLDGYGIRPVIVI